MACSCGDRHSVIAPAKINLTLQVLEKRNDGYHDIESVATKITLYDGIDVTTGSGPPIEIECTDPSVPTDAQNLIYRVVQMLSRQVEQPEPLWIKLHKRIPVGAGLGGGSSDAAAILHLMNQRWNLGLDVSDLLVLAAQIGSDVPMFLLSPAVYMSGRGEIVEAVELSWTGWMVLLFPPFGVSTALVYRHWRQVKPSASRDVRICLRREVDSAAQLDKVLFNDLEESVYTVEPRIRELKETVERRTKLQFHITGSGTTMFACVDTHEQAEQLKRHLDQCSVVKSQVVRVLTLDDNK